MTELLKKDLETYRKLQEEVEELVKDTEMPDDCPDIKEDFDKYIFHLAKVGQATCELANKLRSLRSLEMAIQFNEEQGFYKDKDIVDAPVSELTEVEHNSTVEV